MSITSRGVKTRTEMVENAETHHVYAYIQTLHTKRNTDDN